MLVKFCNAMEGTSGDAITKVFALVMMGCGVIWAASLTYSLVVWCLS